MADYRAVARRAAVRYGLDPAIFERQIQQESGFNPGARSGAGAIGIAQIMPQTAQGWGVDPTDPIAALNAAAKNMAGYVKQFGSYRDALVAYNAGPGRVGKSLPAETQNYVKTILGGATPKAAQTSSASPDRTINALQTVAYGPLTQERPKTTITAPSLAPALAAKLPGYTAPPTPAVAAPRFDVNSALQALARTTTTAADAPAAPTSSPQTAQTKTPSGTARFEGKTVAAWIAPALQYARTHGWKGQVNSGLRSRAEQQRIWDSGVRPAARPGTSNHESAQYPGGAVDVSDPQGLSAILARSPYAKKLQWAGAKDPPHFSHPHGGSY